MRSRTIPEDGPNQIRRRGKWRFNSPFAYPNGSMRPTMSRD
jgi:hypothetical protein